MHIPFYPFLVKTINDYLQAFIDLGVVGCLLFTLFPALLLWEAWKKRRSGLYLAAGFSVVGLSFMQFTTFTSEKISSLLWFAGVVAMLNTGSAVRQVSSFTMSRTTAWVANYLVGGWLFLLMASAGQTISADKQFRVTKARIHGFFALSKERQVGILPQMQQEVRHLAEEVLPRMQFDPNVTHITANQFARFSGRLQELDAAYVFAKGATWLHPNDRISFLVLARIALYKGDTVEAIRIYEHLTNVFGYNPYFSDSATLANLYRSNGDNARADKIIKASSRYYVTLPTGASPANFSVAVAADAPLEWSKVTAAERYRLYVWRQGENKPETPYVLGPDENRFQTQQPWERGTTYFWQVFADGKFHSESGPPWCFRVVRTQASP